MCTINAYKAGYLTDPQYTHIIIGTQFGSNKTPSYKIYQKTSYGDAYLLNLSTNEESVLSSNFQDPTKFSLSWQIVGTTVYIEDFTPDNASPSITSLLLNGNIQMYIEEDGVYYEKYRGKAIERPDLSVISSIENKQNVYSENISNISNPKEGDITVQPSTYMSINPEVTTSTDVGYISNTWNLSPWTDKTIKIENASNGMSSGVNVTYANNTTEFINMIGSNLEVVVTNVISASASGMSNANFNFYVAQEQPIKEYYNGEWIDRNTAQRIYTFENPGYEGALPTYDILNPKCGDVAYCDEKLLTGIAYSSNGEQTALNATNLYNLKLKITSDIWMIYPSGRLTIEFGDNSGWIITNDKIRTFGSGWYEQQSIEGWNNGASIYLDLPPSVIGWMGDTVTCTASNDNDYWGIGISCVYPSITEIYDGTTWVRQTTTIDELKEDLQNNTPSPIKLNTLPDTSITTLGGLEAIGINDIKRAANGLCTGIKYSHTDPYTSLDYVELIPIKSAYYDSGKNFRLKFDYGTNEYVINVDGTNGTVSVAVTTT